MIREDRTLVYSSLRLSPYPLGHGGSAHVRSARSNELHFPELLSVCFWLDKPRDRFSLKLWWADMEPQPWRFWHSEAGTGDLWMHSLLGSHLSLMLGTLLWALLQLLQLLGLVIFYPIVRVATFTVGSLFLHAWRRWEWAQIPAGPSLQFPAFLGSSICLSSLHGFPGASDGKESTCNAGDTGLILGPGRAPGERNDNPLQYSCLENSMEWGAWKVKSLGLQRIGHDQATFTFFPFMTAFLWTWGSSIRWNLAALQRLSSSHNCVRSYSCNKSLRHAGW